MAGRVVIVAAVDGIAFEFGHDGLADVLPEPAARVERAARGWVDGAGNIALKHHALAAPVKIGDRNGRQQGLSLGMQPPRIKILGPAQLHDPAQIHHRDAVADIFGDA